MLQNRRLPPAFIPICADALAAEWRLTLKKDREHLLLSPYAFYVPCFLLRGYIGLGMLIAYKEKYNSSANYMNDSYWSDVAHNNLKGGTASLAWHLRSNHGSEDSTYSTTIKETSESYFSGRGVTVKHVSKWWGFFNNNTIMNSIDADNPVLLFGNLFNPQNADENINHAVVVYKYTDHSGVFGETNFTTHYGWDGYENIYVSGTFGSIYILE